MTYVYSSLAAVKETLVSIAPGMPAEAWWVTACVVWILSLAATVDAFTELVPEVLVFLGLAAVTCVQGIYLSWDIAAMNLRWAILSGLVIWVANFLWFRAFNYDAIGMGDAKWTMLAVACFGIAAGVFAWGIGSVLATILIGGFWLMGKKINRVTFSPFLLVGLGVALCRDRCF